MIQALDHITQKAESREHTTQQMCWALVIAMQYVCDKLGDLQIEVQDFAQRMRRFAIPELRIKRDAVADMRMEDLRKKALRIVEPDSPDGFEDRVALAAIEIALIAQACERFWKLASYLDKMQRHVDAKLPTYASYAASLASEDTDLDLIEIASAIFHGAMHAASTRKEGDPLVFKASLAGYIRRCLDDHKIPNFILVASMIQATIASFDLLGGSKTSSDMDKTHMSPMKIVQDHAIDRIKAYKKLLEHEACTFKQTAEMRATLDRLSHFASRERTDLYVNCSLTAANAMVATDCWTLTVADHLMNHSVLIGSMLHLYSTSRRAGQVIQVERNDILERASRRFFNELYDGVAPVPGHFGQKFREFWVPYVFRGKKLFDLTESTLLGIWAGGVDQMTKLHIKQQVIEDDDEVAKVQWQKWLDAEGQRDRSEVEVLVDEFLRRYQRDFQDSFPVMQDNLFKLGEACMDMAKERGLCEAQLDETWQELVQQCSPS